jgi:hypothetical protein
MWRSTGGNRLINPDTTPQVTLTAVTLANPVANDFLFA